MDITEFNRQGQMVTRRHPWELARLRVVRSLLKDRLPAQHIADIGSGDAFVLMHLRRYNSAVYYSAIDQAYDPEIIRELSQTSTGGIRFGNSTSIITDDQKPVPDLVLLLDVLEHCPDDQQALTEIVRGFSPGSGSILITVPSGKNLFSQHDQLLGHYRRYSRKQLVTLCEGSGLQAIRSGSFFFSLILLRKLNQWLENRKFRNTVRSVDNWPHGQFLTGLFSFILWTDFRIGQSLAMLGMRLPGLSCYCLCQRSRS